MPGGPGGCVWRPAPRAAVGACPRAAGGPASAARTAWPGCRGTSPRASRRAAPARPVALRRSVPRRPQNGGASRASSSRRSGDSDSDSSFTEVSKIAASRSRLASSSGAARTSSSSCLIIEPIRMTFAGLLDRLAVGAIAARGRSARSRGHHLRVLHGGLRLKVGHGEAFYRLRGPSRSDELATPTSNGTRISADVADPCRPIRSNGPVSVGSMNATSVARDETRRHRAEPARPRSRAGRTILHRPSGRGSGPMRCRRAPRPTLRPARMARPGRACSQRNRPSPDCNDTCAITSDAIGTTFGTDLDLAVVGHDDDRGARRRPLSTRRRPIGRPLRLRRRSARRGRTRG